MAINFPNAPSSGQVYEFGDYTYTFDGVKWTSILKYGLAAAKVSSETPPPNPENGLMWYVPSTGESYLWYVDGDSGQWIQENPSIGAVAHNYLEGVNDAGAHEASAIALASGNSVQYESDDRAGFDAALYAEAGIVDDGIADTAVASQRLEALRVAAVKSVLASLTDKVSINGSVWASGQTFNFYNEYMIYNGEAYSPLPATVLPYTVGTAPDLGFVYQIRLNDHSKLSNLNPADGSAHNASDISYSMAGGNVESELNNVNSQISAMVDDISAAASISGGEFSDINSIISQPVLTNKANPNVVDVKLNTGTPASSDKAPELLSISDQLHRLREVDGKTSLQNSSSLGTMSVTRKYDVQAGQYTASLHNAPLGFYFYLPTVHVQVYTSNGLFHSNVTPVTRSFGDRQITFTVPSGATKVTFNIRNVTDFSNTNPMTASALQICIDNLMLNIGAYASDFSEYSNGVFSPDSTLFDPIIDGKVSFNKQGEFLYIRAPLQQSSQYDVVYRMIVNSGLNYSAVDSRSGVVDFWGSRFINKSEASTISAFNKSTLVHTSGMDESCPIRINGMFVAGGHGVIGYNATMSAHGKSNIDVGSIWSDGVDQWVLTYVKTTNNLVLVRKWTGFIDKWVISSAVFSSTTLTHVSGATNTANIVMTSSVQEQFVPIIRDYFADVRVDKVSTVEDIGAGEGVSISETYALMNIASQQDYLIANVGSATPNYTHSSILEQIRFYYEYNFDRYGAVSIRSGNQCRSAYKRTADVDYWGGMQSQRLSRTIDSTVGMSTSVEWFVPDVSPVNGYDLKNVADVTSNAGTITILKSDCDNPADTPSHFAMIGKDGTGVKVAGLAYGYNRSVGLGVPATRSLSTDKITYMSSMEKMYPVAVDALSGDAVVGQNSVVTSFKAPFDPQQDGLLTLPAIVVEMDGSTYVYITSHAALANYDVNVPSNLSGKAISVIKETGSGAISSNFVSGGKIKINSTGYYDVIIKL